MDAGKYLQLGLAIISLMMGLSVVRYAWLKKYYPPAPRLHVPMSCDPLAAILLAVVVMLTVPILVHSLTGGKTNSPKVEQSRDALNTLLGHVEKKVATRADFIRDVISRFVTTLILLGLLGLLNGWRWEAWGLRRTGWGGDLLVGLVGFLVALLPVLLVLLPMESLIREHPQQPLLLLQNDSSVTTILILGVSLVLLAPLEEELIFRVILQGGIEQMGGARLAIVLTSIAFAVVHGWPQAVPLFPLAVMLGWIYQRRRSYLAVVVLHSLFNALNFTMALMAQPTPPGT